MVALSVTGCSDADTGDAPTKAEIDKKLEGQPVIDPKMSAPMGPSKGGG